MDRGPARGACRYPLRPHFRRPDILISEGARSMSELTRRNEGTIAVISGGAQGIGFAIAEQLVEEGCLRIALAGRNEEKGAAAVAQLRARGVDAIFVKTDQSVVADCLRLIEVAVEHFGAVNGLVNAAATASRGTLLEATPEL